MKGRTDDGGFSGGKNGCGLKAEPERQIQLTQSQVLGGCVNSNETVVLILQFTGGKKGN